MTVSKILCDSKQQIAVAAQRSEIKGVAWTAPGTDLLKDNNDPYALIDPASHDRGPTGPPEARLSACCQQA